MPRRRSRREHYHHYHESRTTKLYHFLPYLPRNLKVKNANPEPHAFFFGAIVVSFENLFFHTSLNFVVKMLLQPPKMKLQQRKKAVKERRGCRDHFWCKFQELKMYLKLVSGACVVPLTPLTRYLILSYLIKNNIAPYGNYSPPDLPIPQSCRGALCLAPRLSTGCRWRTLPKTWMISSLRVTSLVGPMVSCSTLSSRCGGQTAPHPLAP